MNPFFSPDAASAETERNTGTDDEAWMDSHMRAERNETVIIETERLFLREMDMDDYDALYRVLTDSGIMQHYPYAFDEKRVREWIERNMKRYKDHGFGLWAVCLKHSGEMIGDCGLTLQNIEGETLPEIGYHIRRDCQHKGYAKEAAEVSVTGLSGIPIIPHCTPTASIPTCLPSKRQRQSVCTLTANTRMRQTE